MKLIGIGLLTAAALSAATPVKDGGPRAYTFTTDYIYSSTKGEIQRRERVTGTYTEGLPGGEARWNQVGVAQASGAAEAFGTAQKRDFMEGFQYAPADGLATTKPDFFKGFPPAAMQERNLVWDVQMFESFASGGGASLKLNQPYHLISSQDVALAGAGTFHNKDVVLTWTGDSERNGEKCKVIEYRAYFNPLHITNPGFDMTGRSHYWGQIWVAKATGQVQYGTLYEDVLAEVTVGNQSSPMVVNVFRIGTFEPVQHAVAN